jgi:polygalacturonase
MKRLILSLVLMPFLAITAADFPVTEFGAVGDGTTLNTVKIQLGIDQIASKGGGTLVIPKGVFLSGAIFLKPGVNLKLDEGSILKGSTDRKDYPVRLTRIEGHFEEWLPALVNADKADHLRISGSGTLDGNGAPFWQEFWDRRKADPKTTNLSVPRPRLMLIQNSKDVQISGISFKDSGFWNLHLYRCSDVLIENASFRVPDGVKCPSTDGTDLDSCQDVTVRGCTYRVDDDCIALKGSKGPHALDDKDSPPVERIRVIDCVFERGNGVVTLGSEATIVRDVRVEKCRIDGPVKLVCIKLRPDTPQTYENLHYDGITLNSTSLLIQAKPWKQYFDLKGQAPPHSTLRDLTISNVTGSCRSLGVIQGNQGQTEIHGITLNQIRLSVQEEKFEADALPGLQWQDVVVNGKIFPPVRND